MMDDLIIIANGDSELPTIYFSNVPHPLWRNRGNAYLVTDTGIPTTRRPPSTNTEEHIPGHGTFELNAGDALFYRDPGGYGNPEDDQILCWVPSIGGDTETPYGPVTLPATLHNHRIKYKYIYNAIPELASLDPEIAENLVATYARTHGDEIRSLYRARMLNNHMGTFGGSHTDEQDTGTGTVRSPLGSNHSIIAGIHVASHLIPVYILIEDVD